MTASTPTPTTRLAIPAVVALSSLLACDPSGPPVPVSLQPVAGDGQQGTVGTTLSQPLIVQVLDSREKPASSVPVEWTLVEGGGRLTSQRHETDAEGKAMAILTLGSTAGMNQVKAAVEGLEPVRFDATGTPAEPAQIEIERGQDQDAPVTMPLPVPPIIMVRDAHSNPVPEAITTFEVVEGGGAVSAARVRTDSNGTASPGQWTLGRTPGPNVLEASVEGLPPVRINAQASPATLNFSVHAVHLNQGSQRMDGSVGGVVGRGGLLRVVVGANEPTTLTPEVRVRLHANDSLLREVTLDPPESSSPFDPDLGVLGDAWSIRLAAAEVVEGLSVDVLVDPGDEVVEIDEMDNRYPAAGEHSLGVQSLPPLRVVFIPITSTAHDTTGSVSESNAHEFLAATRQWIPVGEVDATVRSGFTTDQDLSTDQGWVTLLSDLQALRTAEGAADHYYHGIVGYFPEIAWGGRGYVPRDGFSPYRSALSFDRSGYASSTVAHELGHNLGRRHAPCGGAGNTDPDYPYRDARIGQPGFDVTDGSIIRGEQYRDFMSYCSPEWTSDYTYSGILEWRRNDPWAASDNDVAFGSDEVHGLLIWGWIGRDRVRLNPAVALEAAPVLPDSAGPYVLRGVTAQGEEAFRFSFQGERISDSSERPFSFFVPLPEADRRKLAFIEVLGPTGRSTRIGSVAGTHPRGVSTPAVRAERTIADRVRLGWNAQRFRLAVVRNAATGEILTFGRNGIAWVNRRSHARNELEVLLSDGINTEPARWQ